VFVVDTNVLVHAIDTWSPFHAPCARHLEHWRERKSAWFLTWPIVYEFLRVSTHRSVLQNPFSLPQAWRLIATLLETPGLSVLIPTVRHAEVAEEVFAELPDLHANLLHDAATAILMREHGIRRIMTRDTDFHRFPFLEVLDPVR
jgi:hypothetical protein